MKVTNDSAPSSVHRPNKLAGRATALGIQVRSQQSKDATALRVAPGQNLCSASETSLSRGLLRAQAGQFHGLRLAVAATGNATRATRALTVAGLAMGAEVILMRPCIFHQ
jgi:hypothetical protein